MARIVGRATSLLDFIFVSYGMGGDEYSIEIKEGEVFKVKKCWIRGNYIECLKNVGPLECFPKYLHDKFIIQVET